MSAPRPPTRFLLVRHAQQDATSDLRDAPLSALGRRQAAALAPSLLGERIGRVVCSPMRRATQTADGAGLSYETSAALAEFDFGSDLTAAERRGHRADLEIWRPEHRSHPAGETLGAFSRRVFDAIEAIAARTEGATAVVFTHSGVIDAALRWAWGLPPESDWTAEAALPHASISELLHWPRGRHPEGVPRMTEIVRIGDVSGLPKRLRSG